MFRYKITIEYLGANFIGWQKQSVGVSVQEVIEKAIFLLSKQETSLYAAGRTDAGVHAFEQVAHFDLNKLYSTSTIISGLNHFLKKSDIAILDCELVDASFHARFSAKKRSYIYKILNRSRDSVIQRNLMWHIKDNLDIDSMIIAKEYLVGTHDFTSFQSKGCYSKHAIKTMDKIEIQQNAEVITLYFEAPSFLYHMIRKIVGNLTLVGLKKLTPQEIEKILHAKNRSISFIMAPPCGLYLSKVTY